MNSKWIHPWFYEIIIASTCLAAIFLHVWKIKFKILRRNSTRAVGPKMSHIFDTIFKTSQCIIMIIIIRKRKVFTHGEIPLRTTAAEHILACNIHGTKTLNLYSSVTFQAFALLFLIIVKMTFHVQWLIPRHLKNKLRNLFRILFSGCWFVIGN